jgi:hypothetical protein
MELPERLASIGPRGFIAELATPEIRRVIAQSTSLGYFKTALLTLAIAEQAEIFREIDRISRENRMIEWQAKDGIGVPAYRLPPALYLRFEDIYGVGCWQDEDFVEDTLRHHPGLRIEVKRGVNGQEYVQGISNGEPVIPSEVEGSKEKADTLKTENLKSSSEAPFQHLSVSASQDLSSNG